MKANVVNLDDALLDLIKADAYRHPKTGMPKGYLLVWVAKDAHLEEKSVPWYLYRDYHHCRAAVLLPSETLLAKLGITERGKANLNAIWILPPLDERQGRGVGDAH